MYVTDKRTWVTKVDPWAGLTNLIILKMHVHVHVPVNGVCSSSWRVS